MSTYAKNPSTMKPTFELKMYEPNPQPKPAALYNPYVPVVDLKNLNGSSQFSKGAFDLLTAPSSAISLAPNVKMPVQNVYNIVLPHPSGNHVEMNKIYENILPPVKNGKYSDSTLGERLQIYEFVRQILIRSGEGEEIGLEDETHSLLSHVKLMELYPNYYDPLNKNPYKGLPYGFLIYRSCFPVLYDKTSGLVSCNRNSMGLNIRLYALTIAEYYSYKYNSKLSLEYDVWRELEYYIFVRENIVKKRQSPNFPLLYSFFLSPNNKIDFFSLKKKCLTQKDKLTKDYVKYSQTRNFIQNSADPTKVIRPMSMATTVTESITKLPDEIDPSLQHYSGTTLVLVTEAPTHNLYQWASRKYEIEGARRSMIAHGYYDEKIWLNIIFQIISALYVYQVHGIYVRDMTIADNIYIKDLYTTGKAFGYWKYVINGISYFIPNYGYLVYIDTNYKDIYPSKSMICGCEREYKIYTSDIFEKKISMKEIRNHIFENYRRIINNNSFTKEHTLNDVTRPPESVISLIDKMMIDNEQDLSKVLTKYFRNFMNNRIGTYLRKDSEVPNIRENTGKLKVGDLAVEVIGSDLYKWCMVNEIKYDGIVEIITKENPDSNDLISKDVRIETIKQYSVTEKIDQLSKQNVTFSEDDLLETYIISDNY